MGSEQKSLSILASSEIMSQIDMKLSKSDLIDMLIEEQRSVLESKIKSLSDEKISIEAEVYSKKQELEKHLAKGLLTKNKKLISALKATYPDVYLEKLKYDVLAEKSKEMGVTSISINFVTQISTADDNGKRRRLFDASVEGVANATFRERDYSGLYLELKFSSASLDKATMLPLQKFAEEKAGRLNAINDELDELRSQVSDLTKKNSKARAELTKRLLEESEGGRQLLETMKSVKKNLKF